jgi:hypothetical protein
VQAALDECEQNAGGQVIIPASAGILVTNTSVKIPEKVRLTGATSKTTTATFIADATTNVTAMVENKTQDGSQAYAYVEHIRVDGAKATGATVGAGIKFAGIFISSAIKDVTVTNCSGNGIHLDGANGIGPMIMSNIAVGSCGDHNILIEGIVQLVSTLIDSERPGTGKSAIKVTNAEASAMFMVAFYGIYSELADATANVLWLENVSNVYVNSIVHNGTSGESLVKISTTRGAGSDGAFGSAGHVIENAYAFTGLTYGIDDQVASVQTSPAKSRFIRYYASPVADATADKVQVFGMQTARKGVNLPSAGGTITPEDGNFFEVGGTTDVTVITAAAEYTGKLITLMFNHATPGDLIHDGSNLFLRAGANFNPVQWDTITLISNGTSWVQVAP